MLQQTRRGERNEWSCSQTTFWADVQVPEGSEMKNYTEISMDLSDKCWTSTISGPKSSEKRTSDQTCVFWFVPGGASHGVLVHVFRCRDNFFIMVGRFTIHCRTRRTWKGRFCPLLSQHEPTDTRVMSNWLTQDVNFKKILSHSIVHSLGSAAGGSWACGGCGSLCRSAR